MFRDISSKSHYSLIHHVLSVGKLSVARKHMQQSYVSVISNLISATREKWLGQRSGEVREGKYLLRK